METNLDSARLVAAAQDTQQQILSAQETVRQTVQAGAVAVGAPAPLAPVVPLVVVWAAWQFIPTKYLLLGSAALLGYNYYERGK